MELIKGNLLFFIVLAAASVFLAVWGKLNDGPFRRVFILSRKQNLQYELSLAVKLIIGISVTGMILYYLLCACWDYSGVPTWYMMLILLAPLTVYLFISGIAVNGNAGMVVLVVMICILGPSACVVICIFLQHMKLDSYCGYGSGILLAADFFLGRKFVLQWKRGDI